MKILKRNITLIESLISLFIHKFINFILPLVIIPLLIERVGIDNNGIYVFANSIFVYLLNISQYGFALSTVRDISVNRDDKAKLNEIFNKTFTTKLFIVLVCSILLILMIIFIPQIRDYWQIYIFMILMLVGDLLMPSWFFYGIEKMRFITIVDFILKSIIIGFIYLFIKNENDFFLINFYQSIGYLLSGLIGFYYVKKTYNINVKIVDSKIVFSELKLGFSSFLNLLTPSIFTNTAIFIVGVYLSSEEVTLIQLSLVIIGAFGVLNTIMTNALYPFLNKQVGSFNKAKNIFIFTGIIFSLLMFLFGPITLKLWVGNTIAQDDLEQVSYLIKIFSISPLLMSIVSVYGVNGLLIKRKDKLFSYITTFSTIISILMSVVLTPLFGILGAVVSLLVGRFIYAFLSYYNYQKIKDSEIEK